MQNSIQTSATALCLNTKMCSDHKSYAKTSLVWPTVVPPPLPPSHRSWYPKSGTRGTRTSGPGMGGVAARKHIDRASEIAKEMQMEED